MAGGRVFTVTADDLGWNPGDAFMCIYGEAIPIADITAIEPAEQAVETDRRL